MADLSRSAGRSGNGADSESHLAADSRGQDWARAAETGQLERESGSGGRIRTYDQAVNSRPLYH